MTDVVRRSTLLERSAALRTRASQFAQRLTDDTAKAFIRRTVFHHLDDVDSLLKERPVDAAWMEVMWLDGAEMLLGMADDALNRFESQAAAYGGPEHIRLIG